MSEAVELLTVNCEVEPWSCGSEIWLSVVCCRLVVSLELARSGTGRCRGAPSNQEVLVGIGRPRQE